MNKPRLIHYNDCRHYSFYRYDPPMSAQQIRQPVDEILGTDVDLLSYGLASGQTFLHDTRVGLRWGEQMPSHNHGVMWWRAYESARQAIAAGNDPLRVVVDRAHDKGKRIMCSLRMNDASSDQDGNYYMFGRLKREQPEVMIGAAAAGDHPYAATCANFELQQVQAERLAVIEEVCDRYGADGLEMDPYVNVFFAPARGRELAPVMTAFVGKVRALLDRIGAQRGEKLILAARVHPVEAANLDVGLDVRQWLADGLVDLIIPVMPGTLLDADMPIDWLVEAAQAHNAWVYPALSGVPYDDRRHLPSLEMLRAAATQLHARGVDGLYLTDLPWPYGAREYQILRELSDAEIHERRSKCYFLPHRPESPDAYLPRRPLPIVLAESRPVTVPVQVGDRLASARADGAIRSARLGVRIVQHCSLDELTFDFNGHTLTPDRVEHFYGGLVSYTAARGGFPERINTHHWFYFDLPQEWLREGENLVQVTMTKQFHELQDQRLLHQVELDLQYVEPAVPQGGQM
jgi:hypothetical protein